MATRKDEEANIQSVEVKDQFGVKHQKYFKTMVLEAEVENNPALANKIVKCSKDGTVKLDQLGENMMGVAVVCGDENKTEISIDDYENMKARDIEDLINQKTKVLNEKKSQQIQSLLRVLRNQSLACLLTCDSIFLGILFYKFELALFACVLSVLGLRLASAAISFKKGKSQ